MSERISKKTVISFVLAYFLAYFLQTFFPIYSLQTSREGSIEQVNIVALFVDKKLDENREVKEAIDWYASEYIQSELPNTKAIIIPVDVKAIKAWDIVKMLENMYFDGIKDKTSELKGVILIGDVPLPVIYDKGYVFPSILPYTDFQEQKYVWDKVSQFFVANKNPKSTPELWHGVINFGYNTNAYIHFFAKLRRYKENRGGFVGKNFWYDDFVLLKQTFSPEMLGFYLNGFLFAEDVAYHRFTDLLVGFFSAKHNKNVVNMVSDYVNGLAQSNWNDAASVNASYNQDGDRYKPSAFITFLQSILGQREKAIQEANKVMADMKGQQASSSSSDQVPTQTPTLFLQKAIEGLIKTYNDVVGTTYIKTMMDNVRAAARWSRVDSHVTKMVHQDALYQASKFTKENPLLMQYNTFLEKVLTEEIQERKYAMRIPIPTSYQSTKHRTAEDILGKCPLCYKQKWCEKYEDDKFVNYYFGKEASTIQRAEELSIYRGQFANIGEKAGLDVFDAVSYKQSLVSGYDEDQILAKPIGGSYGVNNVQVEANRGYNASKGKEDSDLYEKEKKLLQTTIECTKYFRLVGFKIFCLEKKGKLDGDEEEDPEDFAQRVWGGASMLAANEHGRLENQHPEYAQVPLYDIAGAKALPGSWVAGLTGQPRAYSYLARDKYASLIHISDRYGPKFYNKVLVCKKVDGLFNKSDEKTIEYDSIKKNVALYKSTGYTFAKPRMLDTTDPCSNEQPAQDNYSFDYLDVYKHPKQNDQTKKIVVNGKVVGYRDGAKAGGKCGSTVRAWVSTYSYKTIDSRVINTSPTREQIIGSTDQLFGPHSFAYQYAQGILSGLKQQFSSLASLVKIGEQQALLFEQGYKWLEGAKKLIVDSIEPAANTLLLQVKNAVAVFLDISAFVKKLDSYVTDVEMQSAKAKDVVQKTLQTYNTAILYVQEMKTDIQEAQDVLTKLENQYKAQPTISAAGNFFITNQATVKSELTKAQLQVTSADLENFAKAISLLQTYRTDLSHIQQTISGLQQKVLTIKSLVEAFSVHGKNISGLVTKIQHDAVKANLYLHDLIAISGKVISGYTTLANMVANELSLQTLRGYIEGKTKGSQYEYTGLVFLQSWKSDILEAIQELDAFTTQLQRDITVQQTIYSQFDTLYAPIIPSLLTIQSITQKILSLVDSLDITNFGGREITKYKIPVVKDRMQKVLTDVVALLDIQFVQVKNMDAILLNEVQEMQQKIAYANSILPVLRNIWVAINHVSSCTNQSHHKALCDQLTGLHKDLQRKLFTIAGVVQTQQDILSEVKMGTSGENLLRLIRDDVARIASVTDMFGTDMQYPQVIKAVADAIKQDVKMVGENLKKVDSLATLAKQSTDARQWIHIFDEDTNVAKQTTEALYPFLHSNINASSDRREGLRYITSYIGSIASILDTQAKNAKNGMSITTPDRPIDSFRNITFQGIGGTLVVLPYPNFYEVPVFKKSSNGNTLELLDEASIRKNVETYLRNLVKTYNEKLAQQLAQSKAWYSANKQAFDAIAAVDPLATPNRTYTLLPEDFLIKKLTEKDPDALATIAHILSIQNSMRQKRPYSKIVGKDLSFIQESADINQKIARVSQEYLLQNNPAPALSMPDYQALGYEVAYINSDGNDYIDTNKTPAFVEKIKKGQQTFVQNKPSKPSKSSLPTSTQSKSECQVPFDGAYLFILGKKKPGEMNWFEAFDCWLKKELTASLVLTYKHAQGPVIPLFDKDTWNKKWFDEATQQLIFEPLARYTGTLVRYKEEFLIPVYEAMLKMYEEKKAKDPTNPLREAKIQRYKAKLAKLKQGTSTQDPHALSGLSFTPEQWQVVANNTTTTLASYVHEADGAKVPQQNPGFLLEYVTKKRQETYVTITNTTGFKGEVFVFLTSTGAANVLTASGVKLYPGYYKNVASFPGQLTIPLGLATTTAGLVKLDVHVCNPLEYIDDRELKQAGTLPSLYRPWEVRNGVKVYYTQCFTKTHTIEVFPGNVDKIHISLPTQTVVEGDTIPLVVKAYDAWGNPISQTKETFTITTTTGTIVGKQKVETTKFPRVLSYKAPLLAHSTQKMHATVSVSQQSLFSENGITGDKRIAFATFTILKPTVQLVKIPGHKTTVFPTGIVAELGETLQPYQVIDSKGITQFQANGGRPSVMLYLRDADGKNISAPVQVQKVGSISPCVLQTVYVSGQNEPFTGTYPQTVCTPISDVVVPTTGLRIYVPTFSMQAGENELTITLPNQHKLTVPITYLPASHRSTKISLPAHLTKGKKQLSLAPDTHITLTLSLTDVWGNTITKPTLLTLASVGNLVFSGDKTTTTVLVSGGKTSLTLLTKKPGGKAYMIAYNAETGYTFENQQVGMVDMLIQGSTIPQTGLNVMYLNLFGTDWGNLWGYFSENNNRPANMLASSDRLLSITTQLIDPSKLRKFHLIVTLQGQVKNFADFPVYLSFRSGEVQVVFENQTLSLGKVNDFAVQAVSPLDTMDVFACMDENSRSVTKGLGNVTLSCGVPDADTQGKLSKMHAIKPGNSFIYIPVSTDSIVTSNTVKDGKVFINGDEIIDIKQGASKPFVRIEASNQLRHQYTVWNVYWYDKLVGRFLVYRTDGRIVEYRSQAKEQQASSYQSSIAFTEGSTNGEVGIGFYTQDTEETYKKEGVSSLDDSKDTSLYVGFRHPFQNITAFAAGQSVGEATRTMMSEFGINFGDPLVRRIDHNDYVPNTHMDANPGTPIFALAGEEILKTFVQDINSDGLKDMVIAYKNGKVRWVKNYGGKDAFTDLQDLLRIAEPIRDVFMGDVDANGYDDIIVLTQTSRIRIYPNTRGIFSVDGYPACLQLPGNVISGDTLALKDPDPSSVRMARQIFFADMDRDGNIDVVTNDEDGDIKIHYGGKPLMPKEQQEETVGTYLSLFLTGCDKDWIHRQKDDMKIIKSYVVSVNSGQKVVDNSLIRRPGVDAQAEEEEANQFSVNTQGMLGGDAKEEQDPPATIDIRPEYNSLPKKKREKVDRKMAKNLPGVSLSAFPRDKVNKLPQPLKRLVSKKLRNQQNTSTKPPLPDISQFPLDSFIQQGATSALRWVVDPQTEIVPVYEKNLTIEDVRYHPLSKLIPTKDWFKVYKTYEDVNGGRLRRGDWVRVTVTVEGKANVPFTYINEVSGPWNPNLLFTTTGKPRGFFTRNINSGAAYYRLTEAGNYTFMLDNLVITDKPIQFGYLLQYQGGSMVDIAIDDVNNDTYPDIKVYPRDGCPGVYYTLVNAGADTLSTPQGTSKKFRTYVDMLVDTNPAFRQFTAEAESTLKDYLKEVMKGITQVASSQDISALPGGSDILETFGLDSFFDDQMEYSQTVDSTSIIDAGVQALTKGKLNVEKVNQALDTALQGLCEGFKIGKGGSCKGPPIPFNMAFLAPGNFQIFGCKIPPFVPTLMGNDSGLPLLAFPATLYAIAPVPVPSILGIPPMLKMPGIDTYGYFNLLPAPGGVYPSLIRIYIAPTLTLGLGFAFCFGPQVFMNQIPSPLRDIVGNCIVFAIPKGGKCKDDQKNTTGTAMTNTNVVNRDIHDRANLRCSKPPLLPGSNNGTYPDVSSSAFSLLAENPVYTFKKDYLRGLIQSGDQITIGAGERPDVKTSDMKPPIQEGQYGPWGIGIIQFDVEPLPPEKITTDSQENLDENEDFENIQDTDKVSLVPAKKIDLKIKGGLEKAKGLIKCIVNDRVERQVKYIINNLTNMTIGVYLPDLSTLFVGFDKVSIEKMQELMKSSIQAERVDIKRDHVAERVEGDGTTLGNLKAGVQNTANKVQTRAKNNMIQQAQLQNFSQTVSNPFDAIATMFDNVPLINFSTHEVNIQVPMIYSEDIVRYSAYLQTWLSTNIQVMIDWKKLIDGILGFCNQSYDAFDAEMAMRKIANSSNLDPFETESIKQKYKELQTKAIDSLTLKKKALVLSLYGQELVTLLKKKTYEALSAQDKQEIKDILGAMHDEFGGIKALIQKDQDLAKSMESHLTKLATILTNLTRHVNTYIATEAENKQKRLEYHQAILALEMQKSLKQTQLQALQAVSSPTDEQRKQSKQLQQDIKGLDRAIKRYEEDIEILKQKVSETDIYADIAELDQALQTTKQKGTIHNTCLDLIFGGGFGDQIDISFMMALKIGLKAKFLIDLDISGLLPKINIGPLQRFDKFLRIQENMALAVQNVRANLKVLDQYRQFPLQLYERIHVIDRYMTEVSFVLESFMGRLMQWLQVNARRFEQYVDAIITLVGVIRTRQAIIDLSVNWQKKCSTCTNDNYTFYGCGFGFICKFINIPILPIPPFRIPSIFLDFSHISANINIKLPEFHFVPTAVPLPQLPDLPGVPPMLANFDINVSKDILLGLLKKFIEGLGYKLGFELAKKLELLLSGVFGRDIKGKLTGIRNDINIAFQAGKFGEVVDFFAALDLTNIPVLPAPPTLPPLPSFIPSVEVNLPTLPPAPKIPNLIPKIEGILDVADLIGKIYCIIKGGIGLVGEKGVKSKIEQLTQRTRNVPWFDDMDLTLSSFFKKDRLQGFDWKIDAYVTFKYNFGVIYDIIQAMAELVNQVTSKVVIEPTVTSFDKANKWMNEKIQEPLNEIENMNIRLDAMNWKSDAKSSKDGEIVGVASFEKNTEKEKGNSGGLRKFVDPRSSLFAYISSPTFKSKTFADVTPLKTGGGKQPSFVHLLNELRFGVEAPYTGSIDVSEAKELLRKGLLAILEKDKDYGRKEKVRNTLHMLETERKVNPNISSMNAIHKEAQRIITAKRLQVSEIAQRLSGSYDQFLSDLLKASKKANVVKFSTDILQGNETETVYTLSSSLFVTDQETKKLLEQQEHPMLSYMNIQQQLVSGFAQTLLTSTPVHLGMDDSTYLKLGREIAYVQSGISLLKSILHGKADYHALEKLLFTKKNMSILPPEKQQLKRREAKPRTCTQGDEETFSGSSSYKRLQQDEKSNTSPDDISSGFLHSFNSSRWLKRYASLSIPQQQQPQPSSFLSSLDVGEYIQGVYIKGMTDGEMVQVVASETHNKNIGKNYSLVKGLNDRIDDIVLRDATTAYIKRGKQNTIIPHNNFGHTKDVYRLEPWTYPEQFLEKTSKTNGYIRIRDIELKVASFHTEVKNFKAIGQSYEAITLSWQNSKLQNPVSEEFSEEQNGAAGDAKQDNQHVVGYVLKMTKRADMFDTKGEIRKKGYVSEFDSPVRYILFFPQGTATGGTIVIPGELSAKKIDKYLPPRQPRKPDEVYDLTDTSAKILTISSYDPTSDTLSFALTKMPRAWYYLQIATLVNRGTQEDPVYTIGSPRSNQVLAGQQLIADDKPPLARVELYRRTTKEVVEEGTSLGGYINTHYDIRITWNDNVEVAKNRVDVSNVENYETLKLGKYLSGNQGWIAAQQAKSGVFVMEGNTMVLSDIFFPTKGRLEFTIGAVDVEGNQAQEKVRVVFSIPSIDIVDIAQVTTGWGTITAQISHDMDEGSVQFQRDRNGVWEPLTSKANIKNFQLRTHDTIVTGGLFSMSNDVVLYLPDKTPFGTIKSNGKIEIYNQYTGRMHLDVTLTNSTPFINIFDTQANKNLFSLFIPPKTLLTDGVILHQGNLTQIPLDAKVGSIFSGGTCIAFPQDGCSIYVSPRGDIYIPPEKSHGLRAFYAFDEQQQTVDYIFTDKEQNKVVTVKIVPKPLIKE